MSLKYTKYEDLCLAAGSKITLNALNSAFKKLIENDNSLIPENSIIPKIWECKWFNNANIVGYNKGDAVWINTEPLDSFTEARYQTIINYLLQNSVYRHKVEKMQAAGDVAGLFELCKNMVNSGKIFYIGDITEPVQIKISLSDNNKELPTDTSSKWKNFFILTDPDTNMQKFKQILAEQTKQLFDLHIKTYHLPETFPIDNYLLRDFSNLDQSKVQRCKSIKYKSNYAGFDYVLMSVKKKYAGNALKWFRLWSSGYLEHGGTIDLQLDQEHIPAGDIKTDCTYTVNLNWKYGNQLSNEAPVYEYEPVDFRDMYCTDLKSDFSTEITYDLKDLISFKTRYIVSLTPCSDMPYSERILPESLDLYETNTVNSIDNSSFMIYYEQSQRCYNYYCAGFTTTMFSNIKTQIDSEKDLTDLQCSCR